MNSQAKQSGNNQKAALERSVSEGQKIDLGKVTNFGLEEESDGDSDEDKTQKIKNPYELNKNDYIFLKTEGIFIQMKQKISETKYLFRTPAPKSATQKSKKEERELDLKNTEFSNSVTLSVRVVISEQIRSTI